MQPVYFSHGYRPREAEFNEYFLEVIQGLDLLPSLDPPSGDVNAAKLEKNLLNTKGMIAILNNRDGKCSPFILYEIAMCIRSRKPIIVLVEDTLRSDIISPLIPQTRFPASGFFRHARKYVHHLQMFKSYLGKEYEPDFALTRYQKRCLIIEGEVSSNERIKIVGRILDENGYEQIFISNEVASRLESLEDLIKIAQTDLALVCIDRISPILSYILGFLQGALVPTLVISFEQNFVFRDDIPREFQPRLLPLDDSSLYKDLDSQIKIFEQDFIDLKSNAGARTYARNLLTAALRPGNYDDQFRGALIGRIVNVQGDTYNLSGQAGNVGPHGTAKDFTQQQTVAGGGLNIDYNILAAELAQLRSELRKEPLTAEQDISVGALAIAEQAAAKEDESAVLNALKRSGSWALEKASAVGVQVAASALRHALGLP